MEPAPAEGDGGGFAANHRHIERHFVQLRLERLELEVDERGGARADDSFGVEALEHGEVVVRRREPGKRLDIHDVIHRLVRGVEELVRLERRVLEPDGHGAEGVRELGRGEAECVGEGGASREVEPQALPLIDGEQHGQVVHALVRVLVRDGHARRLADPERPGARLDSEHLLLHDEVLLFVLLRRRLAEIDPVLHLDVDVASERNLPVHGEVARVCDLQVHHRGRRSDRGDAKVARDRHERLERIGGGEAALGRVKNHFGSRELRRELPVDGVEPEPGPERALAEPFALHVRDAEKRKGGGGGGGGGGGRRHILVVLRAEHDGAARRGVARKRVRVRAALGRAERNLDRGEGARGDDPLRRINKEFAGGGALGGLHVERVREVAVGEVVDVELAGGGGVDHDRAEIEGRGLEPGGAGGALARDVEQDARLLRLVLGRFDDERHFGVVHLLLLRGKAPVQLCRLVSAEEPRGHVHLEDAPEALGDVPSERDRDAADVVDGVRAGRGGAQARGFEKEATVVLELDLREEAAPGEREVHRVRGTVVEHAANRRAVRATRVAAVLERDELEPVRGDDAFAREDAEGGGAGVGGGAAWVVLHVEAHVRVAVVEEAHDLVRRVAAMDGREIDALRAEHRLGHELLGGADEGVAVRLECRGPRRAKVVVRHEPEGAHRLDVREALELLRVVRVVLRRAERHAELRRAVRTDVRLRGEDVEEALPGVILGRDPKARQLLRRQILDVDDAVLREAQAGARPEIHLRRIERHERGGVVREEPVPELMHGHGREVELAALESVRIHVRLLERRRAPLLGVHRPEHVERERGPIEEENRDPPVVIRGLRRDKGD
mmetsp:Transcript_24661/g.80625  ORF Transcript_24661/g.80625 Transcript_24661/m.80625 type:complete len:843 (-) Transcript_24661:1886-4414(-)